MSKRTILPANEGVLKARFPLVYARLMQAGDHPPLACYYDDGVEVSRLFIRRGEHAFPVYGEKKQEKLLDRWFSNLILAPESLYAVTGFGDGSHLAKFLSNTPPGTSLMATEKDPALLRETFSRFDLSDLLANERFFLGVGEPDDGFFRDLEVVALTGVQDVDRLIFAPLYSLDESYYDRVRNELVRQYLVMRPLMEVNIRTAINIQENTFENLRHLANAPDIGELENCFPDVPFILVGAGPSLDESIDFLKNAHDKAIIACSNTPFRKLVNNGISPHIVVTADPLPPTLEGFENISLDDVTLAAPFSAYPEIIRRFSGRVITWSTLNPIVNALRSRTGRNPGTPILEKGTVSACVLDISRLLGCRKVLFVGQDMAIRQDGKYYTEDSSYGDIGRHYNSTDRVQNLPGNTLEKVQVESRLFVYLKTFQEFIAQNPAIQYRNLAEYGARVEGAPYQSLDDALDWISTGDSSKFKQELFELFKQTDECFELSKVFLPTRHYVERLFESSLSAALKIDTLPEKFADLNYANNSKAKNLQALSMEINQLVDSSREDWSILFEGKTKGELVNYRRCIKNISGPNETWNNLQRNKEYYWALAEGCQWLLPLLSKYSDQAEL